ncbi:hypothetical protein HHK36_029346 [Tetracentron sinense]|uniref:Uncharacterized protein n=1 Tax=Tetracentron sinense TaxID=13715 RepID=A0A835D2I1_TETSI|nr:hypothetical protein HHK36_029346 [Tetracentron sinense]
MEESCRRREASFISAWSVIHGRCRNYFANFTKSPSIQLLIVPQNPTLLRCDHVSPNRLWCVFCNSDIEQLHSLFVCNMDFRGMHATGSSIKELTVLQNFTEISSLISRCNEGNLHLGAPPPWFEVNVEDQLNAPNKYRVVHE